MNLQNYGLRIKNKRKEYKLTQNELAIKVGVSRSYISDIENGRLIPSGKIILKINQILPIFLDIDDVNNRNIKQEA
ncbi:helix-turn-helix transcriptional regulator [Staphylococcus epidermidis]|uniref:helix-turn-helix domain-containing protein n=1 Tax=Staphylococcus epidermidis TaxID=1282 RepID=UPI00066AC736|nr:helix-turn-helix transcriptional regulator [Staphylococcus epidermidis]MBM6089031.1 helix-turn-helix transcriptional regulator [Staphylococcus epidermidis]MBM6091504.1 helix-turn-helix transcriptional regulator [Staphylococcus epidermidis]MBM6094028.1 helix-turn-helix transcriptional regulator [Staphylococcus epidermidis]MBM6099010.1 helix-turn-helix transcriptional regulator [Staphylococcus epidermidis]MBM6108902.1 helix-turn-helix transcriptional regulator [Staphylococcus epidermidis]